MIQTILERRNPYKKLNQYFRENVREEVFSELNAYLGDFPDINSVRKVYAALNPEIENLKTMAVSGNDDERRISRLIILRLKKIDSFEPILQKGLNDKNCFIRIDAALYTEAEDDRTRLYNRLIKIIQSDPDSRVRKAAGKRLAESFADMFAVDFEGLLPLPKMLILDALNGHTRIDEERAEALLFGENTEAAYKAARCLEKWGTLERIFIENDSEEQREILFKAASLKVAGYLLECGNKNVKLALKLAETAGRKDIEEVFSAGEHKETNNEKIYHSEEVEKIIYNIYKKNNSGTDEAVKNLPLSNKSFKKAVEYTWPEPEKEDTGKILFRLANYGKWENWLDSIIKAVKDIDTEITPSAAKALASVNSRKALELLPGLLGSESYEIVSAVSETLVSFLDGSGFSGIFNYLKSAADSNTEKYIIDGIKHSAAEYQAAFLSAAAEEPGINKKIISGLTLFKPNKTAADLLFIKMNSIIPVISGTDSAKLYLYNIDLFEPGQRKEIINEFISSGWAENTVNRIKNDKSVFRETAEIIKNLSKDEKKMLFEKIMQSGGSGRRTASRLIRN